MMSGLGEAWSLGGLVSHVWVGAGVGWGLYLYQIRGLRPEGNIENLPTGLIFTAG